MSSKSIFAGALSFIALPDIFQTLGGNNSTGRLKITCQFAPAPGVIYFEDGNPIHGTFGSTKGLDAIYSLFGWTEGRFEFFEEKVKVAQTVKNSRMQIVLDALRMLDDGLIQKVGPASVGDAVVAKDGKPKEGKEGALPVIKGPPVDYVFVINEDSYNEGDTIVREGGYGRWIGVILEGEVKISRETSKGPVNIAQLGEGCFVGALSSLLRQEFIRNATVTAMGNVQLGVLDGNFLAKQSSSLSSDLKKLLISLDRRLGNVTDRIVKIYAKEPRTDELTRDKSLFMEKGSSKEELYIITKGSACVVGQTSKGDLPLFSLEKGDVFGYMPFMDIGHEPRFASILGSEDLEVDRIDIEGLHREYDQLPATFKNLMYNVGICISMTTSLACNIAGKNN